MAESPENPLLSSKPSDSGLTVSLHPLVLLTVSDQVTRHATRRQAGPIAGALLGQQRGREITAEHAFPLLLEQNEAQQWQFNVAWLENRIQQYKDVHKSPALEYVGWFTLSPSTGLIPSFLPLQRQAINFYNDSALLLAFHPETLAATEAETNGRLPFTVYESVLETKPQDDASMQVDGEEASDLKFRVVPYTIETDEAEMIAIDYVAKGAGSAAAVAETSEPAPPPPPSTQPQPESPTDKKGKKRADPPPAAHANGHSNGSAAEEPAAAPPNPLTPEEEDQIASITTRLNSVRMLASRLSHLSAFLTSQEASYLSSADVALSATSPPPDTLPHLRAIQALLTRLNLLTPSTYSHSRSQSPRAESPLTAASASQANDASLTALLSLLNANAQSLGEVGRKAHAVEQARAKRFQAQIPKSAGGDDFGGFGGSWGGGRGKGRDRGDGEEGWAEA